MATRWLVIRIQSPFPEPRAFASFSSQGYALFHEQAVAGNFLSLLFGVRPRLRNFVMRHERTGRYLDRADGQAGERMKLSLAVTAFAGIPAGRHMFFFEHQ